MDSISNGLWYIEARTGGAFVITMQLGGTIYSISDTSYSTGTWYHVGFTYDGDTLILYINGVEKARDESISGIITTFNESVFFGSRAGSSQWFNGKIDEVGIWSRVLNSTEISELYNGLAYPFGFTPTGIEVSLDSPTNNSLITDTGETFSATITPANLNLTNATYKIWKLNNSDWDLFNSTTVSLNGSNETNSSLFIDSFTLGKYKWNILACGNNSTGFVNCSSAPLNYTFRIGAKILNQTYNNITYETSSENFTSYVESIPGVVIHQAYLYYDGIKNVATLENLGSDIFKLSKSLDIDLINISTNKTFFWQFVYTSPELVTQNATQFNQTVNPLFFGLCNSTYNITSINMTIKNEKNFSLINSSLEFNANYYLGSGEYMKELQFKDTNNNKSNFQFCISPGNKDFYIEDIISYYSPDHERREYFLDQATLSNDTQQLSLYLLPTSETTVFTIRVIDEDENNIEGAFVRVQRWDIGTNNYYTVGMIKTTSDGTGIINLRLNDAWYRYQVIYQDELVKTTEPTKESETERVIQITLTEDNPYDQFDNIDYDLDYDNSTNITSLTFADPSGSVQVGCLKILKVTGLGKTEVYYSCVESTSGVLSYSIPSSGTYIIRAIFRLSSTYGSVEKVVDEIIRQGQEERFSTIEKHGAFASLLLVGTAGLIGVSAGSIPLGIGLIIASMIIVNLIGWLQLSLSVIVGIISIFVMIIFNLRRKT